MSCAPACSHVRVFVCILVRVLSLSLSTYVPVYICPCLSPCLQYIPVCVRVPVHIPVCLPVLVLSTSLSLSMSHSVAVSVSLSVSESMSLFVSLVRVCCTDRDTDRGRTKLLELILQPANQCGKLMYIGRNWNIHSTVHKSTALVEYSTVYNNQNLFQPRWIWGISIPRMSPQQILHTVCTCGLSLFLVLRF